MIDPTGVLLPLLVSKIQSIPEVETCLGGDSSLVYSYSDDFPDSGDFEQVLYDMRPPCVLVAWMGTTPSGSPGELCTHKFSLFLRAEGSPGTLFTAIYNGTPTDSNSDGQPLRRSKIHSSCNPIGTLDCARRFMPVDQRKTIDYFEVQLTLVERGVDR